MLHLFSNNKGNGQVQGNIRYGIVALVCKSLFTRSVVSRATKRSSFNGQDWMVLERQYYSVNECMHVCSDEIFN